MKKNKGFIGLIFLVIIGLAALKYFFDWSIFDAAASAEGKGTIDYIRQVLDTIWQYIGYPVMWAWNQIVWPLLMLAWESFQKLLVMGRANLN